MSDYLPERYCLPSILTGDTFPGLTVDSITINGAAPTSALASVRMDFRTAPAATSADLSLSNGSGITIDDAANYGFTVDAFDVALDPALYYFDIETTDADGTIRTYLKGTWQVSRDVTR